jgi:hypothetical protein
VGVAEARVRPARRKVTIDILMKRSRFKFQLISVKIEGYDERERKVISSRNYSRIIYL